MTDTHANATRPEVPLEEYGEQYFKNYNYADRPLSKYSMYWFARRFYAALIRRYAPRDSAKTGGPKSSGPDRLLELGCGLGHLIGLLQDEFKCVGIDLAEYSIEQTKINAPRAEAYVMSADDLSRFKDGEFAVVVGLHLVEHLPDPQGSIRQVNRILKPGGLFLFATPNPVYSLRRYKDPQTDAIGKDPTHINVQPPEVWRRWTEASGFRVLRHFGDGLWDVPYVNGVPKSIQFAAFGLPALLQVLTQTTLTPLSMGVNQICIARKVTDVS
jgi:SAM-dependent methyltransferase